MPANPAAVCGNPTPIELLHWSDTPVPQFPFWWFVAPAIIKGWMGRVFFYGRVYDSRHRNQNDVMRGQRALLTATAGACAPDGRHRHPA